MIKVIFPTGVTVSFNATEWKRREDGSYEIMKGMALVGVAPADAVVGTEYSVGSVKANPQVRINVEVDKTSHAFPSLVGRAT